MNKIACIPAGLILALGLGIWAAGGFHPGWTQTQIQTEGVDEITGLEYTQTRDGFVPGIEFPLVGLFGALLICGGSLTLRTLRSKGSASNQPKPHNPTTPNERPCK